MDTIGDRRTAEGSLHLRDYWKTISQGRYTILSVLAVVIGVTLMRVLLATPVYQATAVVEIKPEAKRILPGQEQYVGAEGGNWIAEEKYFNTQIEVIKSRDVAEKTFRRLHLEKHPLFAKAADPIGAFQRRIEIKPRIETRLVAVSMTGPDPKEVAEWVNTLADVYVRRNVDQAVSSFQAILDEINRGLVTSRASIGQADVERLQLAASRDLYVPENQSDVLKHNLQAYNDELTKVSVEIGSLSSELKSLADVRASHGDYTSLPRIGQDPVVIDLTSQKLVAERELQRLSLEKKPQHPEYVAKSKDVEKLNQRLDAQIQVIAEKLQTQYDLAASNKTYLEKQIRQTQEESFRVQQATSSYDLAKNDAESKRKVYDLVHETMERISMGAQLIALNNNVAILDKAIEPRYPIEPQKLTALVIGGALGLMIGVVLVLFLNYLDNTIRTPDDIEHYLGIGVLAIVPRVRGEISHFAREAYQSLRTSVLFSSHNREKRVVLLTSAGPQEGKSSTTAALARTLATTGDRVVLLDCDLRRPTQHVHMNVAREPGISNYIFESKDDDYRPYLVATDLATLQLLPCGAIPPSPPDLIGSQKFRSLIQALRADFDWVVIDSPPIANLTDTIVLASLAEMVAFVIRHNESDRDLIRRSIKQLRDVRANVIGAVLNAVDLDKAANKGYYALGYDYIRDDEKSQKRSRRSRSAEPGDRKIAL
ncbi:MAG TPA: polysaccharide biosynthesis tyrosine autokinase [Candidatus Polarisedimenticolaceae bacterium]|nr:polysaccharide biosynthesis tyrosine autokinase [Candidatus Polarisedimenticolaceae bacterium]